VTVTTNTFGFGGIEPDPENDRLYWSEPTDGWIMAAHLDGGDLNALMDGLNEPTFLSLDETRSLLWPDGGGSWPDWYSRIRRADLACLEAGNPVDDCLRTMVEENADSSIRGLDNLQVRLDGDLLRPKTFTCRS
jgi:hypothetical protein